MKAEWDELADLAAEVRAVLEGARLRGVVAEPADVPLPEPVAPESGEVPPPREPAPVPSGAWSELAVQSRTEGPSSAVLLRAVRDDIGDDCKRCDLCRDRRTIVFGVGDPEADLVVLGEAPGYHEDQRGEPFVGPAGEMLDKMLLNVLGLRRDQTYILNVVKCRPPKNRNPTPSEIDSCSPFLERQVDAIRPKLVLLLGSVALEALFPGSGGITRNRGRWREWRGAQLLPTFHPAYLLRQPQDKRLTFEDLKQLRVRYDELGGRR